MTPAWYQTAVFYEVSLASFCDGDGDGTGDFTGLASKLDYLQWLGIDCLWLLPFYESPLRDGGYDVSDFRAVRAVFGDISDVAAFLDEAHRRGLRVIGDMILNHTSDRHPWFQEARRPGSPMRDHYVWSDDPTRWSEVRVIFTDTHDSNWTWDDKAGAYYWHRFFWHQPDLNYDNADVRAEIMDVIRFWLRLGFDGLRLDAVPYLYERDGTNCENLPETHAYLKKLRALVDAEFPGRMLLAEANQWPADVVAYFGDGDECHMAYHFPLMPRLFMAVGKGDATALVDILEATPPIPEGCQWGIFLRNHDELTLEMVTPEDRQFMWEHFAPDPQMRKNLGIRRRLAPLLDNDPDRIRLLHGLLLSLPGSPFLYYGDEIGMGDVVHLADRDGVRTPMQWTADRGAGFSTADLASFHLPLVDSAEFSPQRVNVASQRADDGSLLNWVRSMLHLRREHTVFGTGGFEIVAASDPALLAYVRRGPRAEDDVLVVANLAGREVTASLQSADGYSSMLGDRVVAGTVVLGRYEFDWLIRSGS